MGVGLGRASGRSGFSAVWKRARRARHPPFRAGTAVVPTSPPRVLGAPVVRGASGVGAGWEDPGSSAPGPRVG